MFSAWIKGVDAKASNAVWGEKLPFGTVCGEFAGNGWVHSVAFSPSGNAIAWVSHDSTVSIATGPSVPPTVISTGCLPFVSLVFVSETQLLAAGHDCAPFLVSLKQGQWTLVDKIDAGAKKAAISNTAFNKFKQMDSRAQSSVSVDTELNTTHQNTITYVVKD